jgi:hypothetical protein
LNTKVFADLDRVATEEAACVIGDFIADVVDEKEGYESVMKTYAEHRKKF